MLVYWNIREDLRLDGFKQYTLRDGQDCWISSKGYFFDSTDHMYFETEVSDWVAVQIHSTSLVKLVPAMNGSFSVIVAWPEQGLVEVGLDRFAAIPIYYLIGSSELVISENFWSLMKHMERIEYDQGAVVNMLLLGHATARQTMIAGIRQLEQATVHQFYVANDGFQHSYKTYWINQYTPKKGIPYEVWRKGAGEVSRKVFKRYAQGILEKGWTVSVPLSGGLDSRLAAVMLNHYQVPVSAFSYGPTGNADSRAAAQVAEVLGIPYRFFAIDHPGSVINHDVVRTMAQRVGMKARFTTGIGAQLSLSGSAYDGRKVFITGHPANLPTGSATNRGATLLRTRRQAAQFILNNHGLPITEEKLRLLIPGIWKPDLKYQFVPDEWLFNPRDPIGSEEGWEGAIHGSNLLFFEMRTYEAYGRWMLPYCDYELFDFFNMVPLHYRYNRQLHVNAVLHELFVGDLARLSAVPMSNNRPLKPSPIHWKDRLLMYLPPSILGDVILQRATISKQRSYIKAESQVAGMAWGPDPFDYWWHTYPEFKSAVFDYLRGWDGLGGIIDQEGLRKVLERPMSPFFIRFEVAVFLTLRAFQDIAEQFKSG